MNIRLATISDAEVIRDIYQAAITAIPKRLDINVGQRAFWLASGAEVYKWEEVINSQNVAVYIEESNVVGFVSVLGDMVRYLYVHPESKGNGIGFKLLEWAEEFAKSNGVVILKAEATGLANHLFIVRGFEKVGEIGKQIPNTSPFVFHQMSKNLETALPVNKAEGVVQPSTTVTNHFS